jgi:hypothetical protein
MDRRRVDWFMKHGSSEGCIVGHDYYAGNEWTVGADLKNRQTEHRRGYASLAREYFDRYRLPFMLSETNFEGADAPDWLAEVWNDSLTLREEGMPIRGFCWYGFIDHVDWDSSLTRNVDRTNACGLVDLTRRPHAVGEQYRMLALAAQEGRYARLARQLELEPLHQSLAGSLGQVVVPSLPTLSSTAAVA